MLKPLRGSAEIVRLGRDGKGHERFTSREMLGVEQRLESSAQALAERRGHGVSELAQTRADCSAQARGLDLSEQQRDAFGHVTGPRDLSIVIGYAGTGKSAMLGVAKDAWEAQGYQVRGAALSGMAAENLEGGSAIASRTLASWEHAWARGRDRLGSRDVLVIDEAGLVGSRQMERILGKAEAAGAKVVLVGDAEQLQAIEAGAAFRALAERHGAAELTDIRRQQVGWQRDATRHLATERTAEALGAYKVAGLVRDHATPDDARQAVVAGWDAVRREAPATSQVMLAYTRDDVAALNGLARARMREAGALGPEQTVAAARGERAFAAGDRVMFLRNERSLGVKNGSLGEVSGLRPGAMSVRLDDGRRVDVDLKTYADLDHGYATTIHKSQGVTVNRTHVLASAHMDRHATYVAMSRHRQDAVLHYDRESFPTDRRLIQNLGRERVKDTTLDYATQFSGRRGIGVDPHAPAADRPGMFTGFRPSDRMPLSEPGVNLSAAAQAYGRAWADADRMSDLGLPVLEHQTQALERAARALDAVRPGLSEAMERRLRAEPHLADQARRGDARALLRGAEQDRLSLGGEGKAGLRQGPERELSLGQERPPPTRARGLDRGWER
ncbi:MAG: Ti-type conjugative transfer relaxase TraA [Phenylobacterium sp.]|uniref:Ti-type conjugative transfer relaxase TraA n=1 Tax=Phenylobacterium sp. TaxID=1871053 RepID=UPI00273661A3|nr:Ti-type conjugative transfer relaxase TraA [Phenylobacterium sp.]MDP3746258.1 Ti-type conjugative transfer relaxase TraA [Phenylobacterium sp.]